MCLQGKGLINEENNDKKPPRMWLNNRSTLSFEQRESEELLNLYSIIHVAHIKYKSINKSNVLMASDDSYKLSYSGINQRNIKCKRKIYLPRAS